MRAYAFKREREVAVTVRQEPARRVWEAAAVIEIGSLRTDIAQVVADVDFCVWS